MITFYSASEKMTGSMLDAKFLTKDGSAFFTVRSQTGWDPNTKKGSFKNGTTAIVCFNIDELGSMINTVVNRTAFNAYHVNEKNGASKISLSYYRIEPKTPPNSKFPSQVKEGFGFKVERDEKVWKVGLTLGAAMVLKEFCSFAIQRYLAYQYGEDKKLSLEYKKNKEQKPEENMIGSDPVSNQSNETEPVEVDPAW